MNISPLNTYSTSLHRLSSYKYDDNDSIDLILSRYLFNVQISETVRGHHVFVIQPTSYPVNDHLMELLIMCDALKRASAKTINLIIPYYGYSRQDRKVKSRQPISAKLVADLIQAAGANRVIVMDIHAAQIQGFFNIPVDNFQGLPILCNYLLEKNLEDPIVVSPDSM